MRAPLDDATLDALAGLLAHDVAAPLTIAGHVLDSVLERDLPDELRARVEAVVDGIGRAGGHADRAAQFLRLPAADALVPIDVGEIVAAAWRRLAPPAATPTVEIDAAVWADPDLFASVVDELLDFAALGGPTTVTVEVREVDGRVVLQVDDDGATDLDHRCHARGSLCLARTARIVGSDVDVRHRDRGLRTSTVLPRGTATFS